MRPAITNVLTNAEQQDALCSYLKSSEHSTLSYTMEQVSACLEIIPFLPPHQSCKTCKLVRKDLKFI